MSFFYSKNFPIGFHVELDGQVSVGNSLVAAVNLQTDIVDLKKKRWELVGNRGNTKVRWREIRWWTLRKVNRFDLIV